MAKSSGFEHLAKRFLLELEQQKPKFFLDEMKEFGAQRNMYLKVLFVEKLFCKSSLFKEVSRSHMRIPKSKARSKNLIGDGRQMLFYRQTDQALATYARCICHSATNSEFIPQCYAERAAAYFRKGKYECSMKNVAMARKHRPTEELVEHLNQLETDCNRVMVAAREPTNILSGGRPDHFPLDTEIVERAWDDGSKLITNLDLLPWDIIGIEEPFMLYVPTTSRYFVCSYCAAESVAPTACSKCAEVLYCSEDCKQAAYTAYHQYECPVINYLQKILEDKDYPALRMTILAINSFPTRREAIDTLKNWSFESYDLYGADRNFTKLEHYKVITSWERNPNMDTVLDEFLVAFRTVMLKRALFAHTSVLTENTPDEIELFTSLLFHHLTTVPAHMCKIENKNIQNINDPNGTVALGAYTLIHYLPQSCGHNVERSYHYNKMIFYAYKDIPKGTALTQPIPLHEMHDEIFDDFKLFTNMTFFQIPKQLSFKDTRKLFVHHKDYAINELNAMSTYLVNYEVFYPCYQLLLMEHCLWMALNILLDNVPADARLDIPLEILNYGFF